MVTEKKTRKKATKRVSPMKGRIISEEDRGPDAPKLGRPYKFGNPTVRHVVTLSLPEGMMEDFLEKLKTTSPAKAFTMVAHKVVGKKMPKDKKATD